MNEYKSFNNIYKFDVCGHFVKLIIRDKEKLKKTVFKTAIYKIILVSNSTYG